MEVPANGAEGEGVACRAAPQREQLKMPKVKLVATKTRSVCRGSAPTGSTPEGKAGRCSSIKPSAAFPSLPADGWIVLHFWVDVTG